MKTLIRNVLLNNKITNILINDNVFQAIGDNLFPDKQTKIIDGTNKAILPAFYNMHTHSSMSLLRGFCEDKPLNPWLENIWAKEATLQQEDIFNGTKLAIYEMIHSGTVFFLDMYWQHKSIIEAVNQMGIRANIGLCFMDRLTQKELEDNIDFIEKFDSSNQLVQISIAPHAIYTCGEQMYKFCKSLAKKHNLYFQTHLAETEKEFADCQNLHSGLTPTQYLDSLGILDEKTFLAHCVYLSDKDFELISQRNCLIVHNPCSNMKLSSGAFDFPKSKLHKNIVALGTDGNSSNNNLSMIEEMKFSSLLAKLISKKADSITAQEVFNAATINGAKYLNIKAGKIEIGYLADCILVNLNNRLMVPNYNTIYNMVYSADSSVVDTTICNGKILMQNGIIPGEEQFIQHIIKTYGNK